MMTVQQGCYQLSWIIITRRLIYRRKWSERPLDRRGNETGLICNITRNGSVRGGKEEEKLNEI